MRGPRKKLCPARRFGSKAPHERAPLHFAGGFAVKLGLGRGAASIRCRLGDSPTTRLSRPVMVAAGTSSQYLCGAMGFGWLCLLMRVHERVGLVLMLGRHRLPARACAHVWIEPPGQFDRATPGCPTHCPTQAATTLAAAPNRGPPQRPGAHLSSTAATPSAAATRTPGDASPSAAARDANWRASSSSLTSGGACVLLQIV